MPQRQPLLLLGAGTLATNYAEAFGDHPRYEISGFVEDREASDLEGGPEGLPIYRTEDALRMSRTHAVICCIGSVARRALVERFEAAGFEFATLISPTAVVHPRAVIEPGCIISDQTDVDPHTRIGRHSIVSAKVSFGHHSTMGAYGFIGPGAILAGNLTIGDGCMLGMASVIRDGITIGDGATVGAGAVVVKDVAPGTTVAGVPAREAGRAKGRKPLLFLGAGSQAVTYAEHFRDHPDYEITGFVQDADAARVGQKLEGLPIHGVDEALKCSGTRTVISAIGSPERRRMIERFEAAGFEFARLISLRAVVTKSARLGPGCIVSDFATVETGAEIGPHCLVMRGSLVAHHTRVGAFSNISPSASIGGGCHIGEGCVIGLGAIVRDHVIIGDGATIGAGAVVVRDVPAGTTVAGVPAMPMARGPKEGGKRVRKPLLILGAGEQAAAWTRKLGGEIGHEIEGYVQSVDAGQGEGELEGRPVYWVEDALKLAGTHAAICMIGTPARNGLVERFEAAGFEFIRFVSRLAVVAEDAKLGPGCIVTEFATIEPFCEVGAHTEVLRGSIVSHHARIGRNCIIGAGAMLGGGVRVGDRCFIGMGATVRDHVAIGEGATVGAGAVVVSDVPAGVTVVGNPARPIGMESESATASPRQRQRVLLLGAGEQAASYAENVADHPEFEVVGFVQDTDPGRKVRDIEGRPVYYVDDVKGWHTTHKVVCCIGSMKKRVMIRKFEAMGFEFVTLVATTALVSPKAELGPGCFVSHTGQVASFAKVGAHTMIGRQTMVGHHSTVGPYSLIAGQSVIGGGAKIGEGCFIGMGALIRDHVTLGDNVTVGVGAVVVKDVPAGVTVAGVPARILESKETERGATASGRQAVLFLGAGTMAENYAQIFRDDARYEVAGFVVDTEGCGKNGTVAGCPVYTIEEGLKLRETHAVISCIGSPGKRGMIERFEAAGFRFATMIAPSARVDPMAEVGSGCFINHDTSVAPYSKVGAHTMVMRRVVVGHHASIGGYGTIGPGVLIAGSVRIGEGCFIGIGAIISDHVTLGDGVTVGAGAVVVKDVAAGATVAGNPARPLPPKPQDTAPGLAG